MHKRLKYLLLLPLTGIISCGYSTSYLVEGDKYTSANFKENYYTHWDNELKSAHKEDVVDVSDPYLYTYSFSEGYSVLENIGDVDPNFIGHDPIMETYGAEYKMVDVDDSFRYGYQSKLFDGQMVCGAQNGKNGLNGTPDYSYQKGRVQIKQSGFSVRFSKESSGLHYFAMQFKTSTDNTSYDLTPLPETASKLGDAKFFHKSIIDLSVTLYTKDSNGINGYPFKAHVDLTGKIGDNYLTNNGHCYTFLAIDLAEYKLTRLIGVSVDFEVLEDNLIEYNTSSGITYDDYALFLYEMFFPYTSWN